LAAKKASGTLVSAGSIANRRSPSLDAAQEQV
jgi:hypothetical protein